MRNMSEAPRDGSRILVLHRTFHLNFRTNEYETSGITWEECFWAGSSPSSGFWQPWKGSTKTMSTDRFADNQALGWLPRPDSPMA